MICTGPAILRSTWAAGAALMGDSRVRTPKKKESKRDSGEGDLNSRPMDHCTGRIARLYSPLLCQLSYPRDWRNAPTWDRTKDLVVNSHSLYQRSSEGNVSESARASCSQNISSFRTGSVSRKLEVVIRSYHGECTASHQNCEVKHRWA